MLLVGCMMHDVGDIYKFATINGGKNGMALLYLDGIKVMFTHKRCKPLFVLDSVENLDPELLEDDESDESVPVPPRDVS